MFGMLPLPFMARGLQDKMSLLHLRNRLFSDMIIIALDQDGYLNDQSYARCGFIADTAVEVFDRFIDKHGDLEADMDFLCFFRDILSAKVRGLGIWTFEKTVKEFSQEVCELSKESASYATNYRNQKFEEWDREAEKIEKKKRARTESFKRKQEIKRLKTHLDGMKDLPKQLENTQADIDKLEAEEKAYRDSLVASEQYVGF